MEHLINIGIHILTGTIGIIVGLIVLALTKENNLHKRLGQWFCYMCLAVCVSAATGLLFFRFLPVFALLNLLVFYQLVGGWRSARTKAKGPAIADLYFTLCVTIAFGLLFIITLKANAGAPIILYSTAAALAFMLVYDAVRWFFPRRVFTWLWKYEHAYKLISCVFGMISAFMGNSIRWGQPWSQIVPSAIGIFVIMYFFYRIHRGFSLARKIKPVFSPH